MCGITGFIDFLGRSTVEDLHGMIDQLEHRGPDDKGGKFLCSQSKLTIGLGHTRLSILDLSSAGHQPMEFENLTIVYNGEIYNFQEIKDDLKAVGHIFQSDTDTEVILHAYKEWGFDCVTRFIGMFAFAIYDKTQNQLVVCRDRAGVKPLFYYHNDGLFLFASELKSFHAHPEFKKEVDELVMPHYLNYGYIPAPMSIFKHTYKLEAGNWMTINLSNGRIEYKTYWSLQSYFNLPLLDISFGEAKDELEKILDSACRYRLISDVPVGVFLSGGVDSTLVTALLQKDYTSKLKTFTIGFPDGVNEAPFARKIAEHIGTDHTEYNCSEADAKIIIPELPYYFDEPCADISTIPTILVSRLAKKDVKVVLSADGGDEIFAGYTGFKTHLDNLARINKIGAIPFTSSILKFSQYLTPRGFAHYRKMFNGMAATISADDSFKLATLIRESSIVPDQIISKVLKRKISERHPFFSNDFNTLTDQRSLMLLYSFEATMIDLLMVKVDRSTMSTSIEGREPLLDHRIIEYAAQLPFEFKHDGHQSKKILKEIAFQYVPKELLERPKTGFDLPLYKWLRGDLQYLLDVFLTKKAIQDSGIFDVQYVDMLVRKLKNGKLRYLDLIWRILFFQMWHKKWI